MERASQRSLRRIGWISPRYKEPDQGSSLLREVALQEGGAVIVDGAHGLEGGLVEGSTGEHGDGPDAGGLRSLYVSDRVAHGDSIVRGGFGPFEGELEDVGGWLGVLHVARLDDAGDPALRPEHLLVAFELLG